MIGLCACLWACTGWQVALPMPRLEGFADTPKSLTYHSQEGPVSLNHRRQIYERTYGPFIIRQESPGLIAITP